MEAFDAFFKMADVDKDGRISGSEAVAFFQGSNLPKQVLAQIWMHADQNRSGFLGRAEFYNALKLVTVAQSGRDLTPDIVKAALFGPAAAKIPAPKMNSVAMPTQTSSIAPPAPQMSSRPPTAYQNIGFRGPQAIQSSGVNQQIFPSSDNQFIRPPQAISASIPAQGTSGGFPQQNMLASGFSTSNLSNLSFSARPSEASMGAASLAPNRGLSTPGPTSSMPSTPGGVASSRPTSSMPITQQTPSWQMSSLSGKLQNPALPPLQPSVKDSKPLAASGNGFSSNSVFGGEAFSATPQPTQDVASQKFNSVATPTSSNILPVSTQSSFKQGQVDPFQSLTSPTESVQFQQPASQVKQKHDANLGSSSITARGPGGTLAEPLVPSAGQIQSSWPKITQSDIQKYTKVFVDVDKDRYGKITGEQARNLFLSWRLPREVLKQVWDLSDQDNDSMLSLREFCTALYLMERYREGRPLPALLPDSVRFDEALLKTTGQPTAAFGWQPTPGFREQGFHGAHSGHPASGTRLRTQVPFPHTDGAQLSTPQKSLSPLSEKQLANQQRSEDQSTFHMMDLNKKVERPETEVLDSKERIEFYRTKMQELVLYKSRCDNQLNEITERASADKREAELLAKKYDEKYKQVAELASKLTIEEAAFRETQERKMELRNAIVNMEQGGSADGLLQVRADRIQSDLEELGKALNERCKRHGLSLKSTATVELPFGWQPGIQEGAAIWDEDWDKFEDEGFVLSKDNATDVSKTMVPPSPASGFDDKSSIDETFVSHSSDTDGMMDKPPVTGEQAADAVSTYAQSVVDITRSPPGSPHGSSLESPSHIFSSKSLGKNVNADDSLHAEERRSDHADMDSSTQETKFDGTSWGANFDANDEDSVWGFTPIKTRESDHEQNSQNSFFHSGDFGLNPIGIDSPNSGNLFEKKENSQIFADSIPNTPLFRSSPPPRYSEELSFDSSRFNSFSMDEGGSGVFPQGEHFVRFDSIRSTADSDRNRSFTSFDESDPFGSTGPFRPSGGQTRRQGSDGWSAF